ncbi:MAG: hypothetical protein WC878_07105 [Candidatus Paceibacterota bacterium]|jgi:hypothetical protein
MWRIIKKTFRPLTAGLLALAFFLVGFPPQYLVEKISERNIVDSMYWAMKDGNVIDKGLENLFTPKVEVARAANFGMKTGYYIGDNSSNHAITGLGFSPDLVIIKSDTSTGQGIWKTSAMPAANFSYFSATAQVGGSLLVLDADGFTVKSNVNMNTANVRYIWVAFSGSDCTASGTFCVGTYTGDGAATRAIPTGFTPSFAMVKRSTNAAGNFRTASMGANVGNYFTATAQNIGGVLFRTLDAASFTVGSTNNVNNGSYYFAAFATAPGIMAEGTYAGDGLDNKNITGLGNGYTPNFVFVKNAGATGRSVYFNTDNSNGDYSSRIDGGTANAVNFIQALQNDGFQVGTSVNVNTSGETHYWVGFGGEPAPPPPSGTFTMANGTYTGTGAALPISGLGFSPDLVLVKDNALNYHVFRTRLMKGDSTAYLSNAAANFTLGITSLDADGFSIGTNAIVNTNTNTYQWTAFGNAYNTEILNGGAADFAIGAYTGAHTSALVSSDNRNITGVPFQPDLVAVKRAGATAGVWHPSVLAGDLSMYFGTTAGDTADIVQAFNSDGFQIGTNAGVNTAANLYQWFAFKNGPNFTVNTYTGTGAGQNITTPGFQPDLLWIKRSTAVAGVSRPSSLAGNLTQYLTNVANIADRVTNFLYNGFSLTGVSTETNANLGVYRYAAWQGKKYTQSAFRWFYNLDSTDVGNPIDAKNAAITLGQTGSSTRLRMLVHVDNANLFASGQNFKLQFATSSGECDVNFAGEDYRDVTASTFLAYKNNPTPVDGASLTVNGNDPTNGFTVRAQTYEELNNFTNISLAVAKGEDALWDFSLYDNSAPAFTAYCLRAVKSDGALLNVYSVIPGITMSSIPTFAQNYFRFYEDNDALKPTVPWAGLGEIANITTQTEPPAVGEKLRLRMTLLSGTKNAPALSQSFRLQYGKQITSCSAIAEGDWSYVGAPGSASAWRGVNATPVSGTALSATNPPTAGDVLISGSDRAGTYEESGETSALNPYAVAVGEEAEYDWILQNNGADTMSDYCFRMATTTTGVMNAYSYYPTIRTSGFRPKSETWRWYDDEASETPSVSLGGENVSPSDVAFENIVKLRLTVKDTANVSGTNVKFKLQFSEYSDFSAGVQDVVDQGACLANSLWCYADGGGLENGVITAKNISDADACAGGIGNGCGTHNETPGTPSSFTQTASAVTEYEFTVKHAGARANRTYYFRLYNLETDLPVPKDAGKSYPSLATEGAAISFGVLGLPVDTATEGTVTNIPTTATSISFGALPFNFNVTGAQRFTVSTNATEGYQLFVRGLGDFLSERGDKIQPVMGTNAAPSLWTVGCDALADGCFGYHAGDDILSGGSTRFLVDDNFAELSTTTSEEVAFSSVPVTNEITDIVFRTKVTGGQSVGNYNSSLAYIIVPVF